jgi:hypothetical protein
MKGITMAKSMGKKGTICGPNNIGQGGADYVVVDKGKWNS